MIDQAVLLAAEIHAGQEDKGGEPYILHPIAVMEICKKNYQGPMDNTPILVTALLHDVLEDFSKKRTPRWTKSMLTDYIGEVFGNRILSAVERLSRDRGVLYEDYIEEIANDWVTTEVKIADLTHNMDVTRLPSNDITRVDYERWDKYRKALVRLKRG